MRNRPNMRIFMTVNSRPRVRPEATDACVPVVKAAEITGVYIGLSHKCDKSWERLTKILYNICAHTPLLTVQLQERKIKRH